MNYQERNPDLHLHATKQARCVYHLTDPVITQPGPPHLWRRNRSAPLIIKTTMTATVHTPRHRANRERRASVSRAFSPRRTSIGSRRDHPRCRHPVRRCPAMGTAKGPYTAPLDTHYRRPFRAWGGRRWMSLPLTEQRLSISLRPHSPSLT